ncbi:transient receptor potential channel pyrexia-like [Hyposmocoma kahamanoa]|uniref:transient receptor potential channel pyrexia-like n=1 Tax=Hyposmocoma kahamanoa TaxID=1477025 RepID=UPI000E6D726E|nr:transient receptor potential channel pyrexia-like [Hyposmocoma kahamanoa]
MGSYVNNAGHMNLNLYFTEDMPSYMENDNVLSKVDEVMKNLCPKTKDLANIRCTIEDEYTGLSLDWNDNILRCSVTAYFPVVKPGWTPLHVASAHAQLDIARLLLAVGADPNVVDKHGYTPLDVVCCANIDSEDINVENFTGIIKTLLEAGGQFNTMKAEGINYVDTPLHMAVELKAVDTIKALLNSGASVVCLNKAGQTPLHVCVLNKLEEPLKILVNHRTNDDDPLSATVNVKDCGGHTMLHVAVAEAWMPGVCIALEAGADVTLKANNGETPVHTAAALGNIDILDKILISAKQTNLIDCQNGKGETPLFKAIYHGHLDCVKALLVKGDKMKIALCRNIKVLCVAAENGHTEILKYLLSYIPSVLVTLYNKNIIADGFGLIHFAVSNNHADCVKLLLFYGADIKLKTTCNPDKYSTPLHIAAVNNYVDIARILLEKDKTTIHVVNSMGWTPLHSAAHHSNRDVITLLLREGADLSGYTTDSKELRKTAIGIIVNNLSKPIDFMEEVFDSYISRNDLNVKDPNCKITVDYSILLPSACENNQMKVIQALMKTGNKYGQNRLLVHPLVESFLYLKWKALLPLFNIILAMHVLFVMSLTVFSVSVFFYKDTDDEPPTWLSPHIWMYIVYVTIALLLLQQLLYMNIKGSRHFILAAIFPFAVIINSEGNWTQHITSLALLLSWMELMFFLSRFPNWGYYIWNMFGKFASNVLKILAIFVFLLIAFSLCIIQFKSKTPSENPWEVFVKTMDIMTSEFDYKDIFFNGYFNDSTASLIIVTVIFLIFVIVVPIVLLNLTVRVGDDNNKDMEVHGNIRRLAKQVEFLCTLNTLVHNKVLSTILPREVNRSIKNKSNVVRNFNLYPGKPGCKQNKLLPSRLQDEIFNKALIENK